MNIQCHNTLRNNLQEYEQLYNRIYKQELLKPRNVNTLKLSVFFTLYSQTQNTNSQEYKMKELLKKCLQRRIKEPSKVKTFHEKYTLIIQLIVCNNPHYSIEYFFIKR